MNVSDSEKLSGHWTNETLFTSYVKICSRKVSVALHTAFSTPPSLRECTTLQVYDKKFHGHLILYFLKQLKDFTFFV